MNGQARRQASHQLVRVDDQTQKSSLEIRRERRREQHRALSEDEREKMREKARIQYLNRVAIKKHTGTRRNNRTITMLILTRRVGETLMIGNDVIVTVLGVKGNQIRLGINAPKHVAVHREEIFRCIERERVLAVQAPEQQDVPAEPKQSGCVHSVKESRPRKSAPVPRQQF